MVKPPEMTDLRKAAEMALDWMERYESNNPIFEITEPIQALRQALANEALDRMVAENERLGLYEDGPAVKSYCGGKPNYCTPEETFGEKQMKIVINVDYGGFGLSEEATRMYLTKTGQVWEEEVRQPSGMTLFWLDKANEKLFWDSEIPRNDPILVEIVEALKSQKASSPYASLKVVEIPEGVNWYIVEHDGMEHIAERHQVWK